jgi:hypothetical protein
METHDRRRGRTSSTWLRVAALVAVAAAVATCRDSGLLAPGSGSLEEFPSCQLSATSLDFGVVAQDSVAEQSFVVRNIGDGVLRGAVQITEASAHYEVIAGGGSFTLGPGDVRRVAVRFRPRASGPQTCSVAVATGCRLVACSGVGRVIAMCRVEPESLRFGAVVIGRLAESAFRIVNEDTTPIAGSVFAPCEHFTVVDGGGPFALAAGETATARVRFEPLAGGPHTCAIDLGTTGCGPLFCDGVGDELPECAIDLAAVSFGAVTVGAGARDTTVTITNAGTGVLSGSVALGSAGGGGASRGGAGASAAGTRVAGSASCGAFAIVSGGGAFSLGARESHAVVVRFDPASAGAQACSLVTGAAGCPAVALTGTALTGAQCQIDASALAFDGVEVGGSAEADFSITNTGDVALEGDVSFETPCASFAIVSGGGAFSLGGGQTRTVTVRFAPLALGPAECAVALGSVECAGVVARGEGIVLPICAADPPALAFGVVPVGSSADQTVVVTNAGGDTLAGDASIVCAAAVAWRVDSARGGPRGAADRHVGAPFAIVSGGGAFALAAGDTHRVVVRFAPAAAGEQACALDLGAAECASVPCGGVGDPPPACAIEPPSLDFGVVLVGATAQRTATLRNAGGGTLTGSLDAGAACAPFALLAGGGAFALAAGEERAVTLEYAPSATGAHACTLSAGAGCPPLVSSGSAAVGECIVSPTTLDFGTINVGATSASKTFTIRNPSAVPLSGSVDESCADFSIVSGGGAFALAPGDSVSVSVRFAPTTGGALACTVSTGSAQCAGVGCAGTGALPPACVVSPETLDFGAVTVLTAKEDSFTVTNTGGGTLSGNVTFGSCTQFFAVFSGLGSLNLGAGQSKTIKVRFSPGTTPNVPRMCTLDISTTGSAQCADPVFKGIGAEAPVCKVSPATLDFGPVSVGSTRDSTFIVTNTGGGTLAGAIDVPGSGSCGGFQVVGGGGPFALAAGETLRVTMRFAPSAEGTASCAIVAASGTGCTVTCKGDGDPPAACEIVGAPLAFGLVNPGSVLDQTFTIKNSGGGRLPGDVSIAGATSGEYTILSGGGPFELVGSNASINVTVRFAPTNVGDESCTIETGSALCADVACTGRGEVTPVCAVSTGSLTFGNVVVGGSKNLTFRVTNTGGGTMSVTVSESCSDFLIPNAGDLAFSLAAGAFRDVTVRFQPITFGARPQCTVVVNTGSASCPDVVCTGTGAHSYQTHIVNAGLVSGCSAFATCHCNVMTANFCWTVYSEVLANGKIDLGNPANSTFLLAPSGQVSHSGGVIPGWGVGESSYNTVLQWIQTGALP